MGREHARIRLVRDEAERAVEPASAEPLAPAELFHEYSGYVAVVATRLLGRNDEIDDVVQEVFLRALKGVHRLRDTGAIKGWLATVTVRVCGKRLTRRRRAQMLGWGSSSAADGIAPGASPEQQALLAEVYAVLDSLPAAERVAWCLRHVQGETLESVAELTGCSLATAKRRIRKTQEVLRKRIVHG